jgi:hypothetical protein
MMLHQIGFTPDEMQEPDTSELVGRPGLPQELPPSSLPSMESAAVSVANSSSRAAIAASIIEGAMGEDRPAVSASLDYGTPSSTSIVQLTNRLEAQLAAESAQLKGLLGSLKDSRLLKPQDAAALLLYKAVQRSGTTELAQAPIADRWCTDAQQRARRKLTRQRAQQIAAKPTGAAFEAASSGPAAPEAIAAGGTSERGASTAGEARLHSRLEELELQLCASRAELRSTQLELHSAQLAASESAASQQLLKREHMVCQERLREQGGRLEAQVEKSARDSVEMSRLREEIQHLKEDAIEYRTRRAVQLEMTELAKKAAADAEAAFRVAQHL